MSRILFYAINGIGLGHAARLSVVARAIRDARPELDLCFHSNSPGAPQLFGFPGSVEVIRPDRPAEHYNALCRSLELAVATHRPDVLVCDTHWPDIVQAFHRDGLRTALVLRMPDIEYASKKIGRATTDFDVIVLPHQPAAIDAWLLADPTVRPLIDHSAISVVGPLARVLPLARGCRQHVLFMLGGGGDYPDSKMPIAQLVQRLAVVARALRLHSIPSAIMQGPLMTAPVPTGPWDVLQSPEAPKYISEQTVVVSRPSYNTCWETIARGARLVIVAEQNGFHEDAIGRARWLEEQGLAVRASLDTVAEVIAGELDRGWDAGRIRSIGRVNEGLPEVVRRIVGLTEERA